MELFFEQYSGIALYIFLLLTLVITGFGIPISEDLILMVIGYLIHSGRLGLVGGCAVAFLGCLASDFIVFNIGYHFGRAVRKHRFILRVISHGRQEVILQKFRRYGDKFIIFARFIAGVRAPTFLTAGISHLHPLRFLMLDGFASLFSVPLFVGLGYLFADHLAKIEADVSEIRRIVTVLIIGAIALLIFANYLKLFKDKPDERDLEIGEP